MIECTLEGLQRLVAITIILGQRHELLSKIFAGLGRWDSSTFGLFNLQFLPVQHNILETVNSIAAHFRALELYLIQNQDFG